MTQLKKVCKNCTHFNWKLSGPQHHWGECLSPDVLPMIRLSLKLVELDTEQRADVNNYARVQFDEESFGCIHFEAKE